MTLPTYRLTDLAMTPELRVLLGEEAAKVYDWAMDKFGVGVPFTDLDIELAQTLGELPRFGDTDE